MPSTALGMPSASGSPMAESPAESRDSESRSHSDGFSFWKSRGALIGGGIAALVTVSGVVLVGTLSGYEARKLVLAMLPTARFLCSTFMTVTATVLALMLTVLGLSHRASEDVGSSHYDRIRQIAFLDVAAFIASLVFLLLLLAVPIQESENVPNHWFTSIYYTAIVSSSLIGGLLVAIVLLLNQTLGEMIDLLGG